MSTMLQDCPPVQAAYEELKRFSSDSVMREKARARQRFLDEQMIIMNDVRGEGEAIGEARGEARGRAEKARETAAMMKREGFDSAVIAKITGLPLAEIERL